MTTLYRVTSHVDVHFNDPLHWSNFFPDKLRHHRSVMAKRQDLILYLANLHAAAIKTKMPLGMVRIPMRLTSLRDWVSDYRIVLDRFFSVEQLGYNLGEGNHEVSILIPKPVGNGAAAASKAAAELAYEPPHRPDDSPVVSKVYIQQANRDAILQRLATSGRLDLKAAVMWLLDRPEVNFHFKPSGRLQQRDTSVWPVMAVETWPSWLREQLFGPGVDIDSAYTQFIVSSLKEAYAGQETLLHTLYPDLLNSLHNKQAWRVDLCQNTLGLPPTDDNIGTVKRLCMSLANGSKISPAILTGSRAYSITADIVIASAQDVSLENLTRIGERLQSISRQYSNARKILCTAQLKRRATRKNQKEIFSSYFAWERVARYAIWNECEQHGVMVHDGIDGVPAEYLERLPDIMRKLDLRLS